MKTRVDFYVVTGLSSLPRFVSVVVLVSGDLQATKPDNTSCGGNGASTVSFSHFENPKAYAYARPARGRVG